MITGAIPFDEVGWMLAAIKYIEFRDYIIENYKKPGRRFNDFYRYGGDDKITDEKSEAFYRIGTNLYNTNETAKAHGEPYWWAYNQLYVPYYEGGTRGL